MTSFTRKLYMHSPAAAEDFHRAQSFEHRMTFGKPTLPVLPEGRINPQFHRNPTPMVQFGKRAIQPTATAYECWMPDPRGFGSPNLKPKVIVYASNSFEARKQFAAHHGIEISDVACRRVERTGRVQ